MSAKLCYIRPIINNMRYSWFWSVCIVALVFVCACSKPSVTTPVPSDADISQALLSLPAEKGLLLNDLPQERISRQGCHRDAYVVNAGITRVDFPSQAHSGILTFFVLPATGCTVSISVYEDEHGQPLTPATDDVIWAMRRVALDKDKKASVVFSSEQPFHLAIHKPVDTAHEHPDVIVYLIDTLRQDHLGCYYYPLDTSPHIDQFAEDATRFFSLIPMASWTRPSIATLLTGVMDYTHHALSHEDHLRTGLPSLAKNLELRGWTTHGITSSCVVTTDFGFGLDFQWYEEVLEPGKMPMPQTDVEVVDRVVADIASAEKTTPLFMFVHVMAPHREYEPPEEYRDMFMPEKFVGVKAQTRVMQDMALYDGEIRFSDDQFARVIQALKDTDRYENALIVLIADHGEQFMEHGEMAHANSLHYHELKVPFIIKLPGNMGAGSEVRHIVQMADVAPTILDALGLDVPAQMEGRSLMPLITLKGAFPPRPAFARLRIDDRLMYMAQNRDLKYIYNVVRQQGQWYDLQKDCFELDPLFIPPEGGEELRAFAEEQAARPIPEKGATSPPLTELQTEQLEALGYL